MLIVEKATLLLETSKPALFKLKIQQVQVSRTLEFRSKLMIGIHININVAIGIGE